MPIRSIRIYPGSVLRVQTKRIHALTDYHHRVITDLIDTLKVQPGGIGIAAPQIGYPVCIAVVDVSKKDKAKQLMVMVNPEILSSSGEKVSREGCMSIPDFTGNVKRATQICVRWYDRNFTMYEKTTDGLEAICIQHEIDHLNGYLFLDHVSSMNRDVFRRKKYLS